MVLRKILDPCLSSDHLSESDPSKGLEIMRCSSKVLKGFTYDVTRGREDSSYSSI